MPARRVVVAALAGAALIVSGLVILAAVESQTGAVSLTAPVYMVAQVAKGVVLAPHAWKGRPVRVRAVLRIYGASGAGGGGALWHWGPEPILTDNALPVGHSRAGHGAPLLLVRAAPPPDPLTQAWRWLAGTFHLRLASHAASMSPTRSPAVYAVRVLGRTGCPPSVASLCIAVTLTAINAP